MKQRVISLFAALCLALALQLPALAADYPDMPAEGSWSYEPLTAAVENGLLQGTDGLLQPGGTLTRAQLAAILVRAFGATETSGAAFTDVSDSNWFAADVSKAVAMGVLGGSDGKMRPNDALTRQETFVVLARALCLADGAAGDLSAFSDAAQVSGWAAPSVAAMVNAGYVSGSGGALNPQGTITRAEFAQVMYNIIGSYITEAGTYTTVADGTVLVRAAGATLQGVTVDGDLILGDGAGSVTLDNVTVTGRVLVRGGDENAVQLVNGSTAAGGVVVREDAASEAPAETPSETVEGEPVTVTTAEAFLQALSDPKCSAITVSGGVELPAGSYTINKPVTVGGLDNYLLFLNAQVVNNSTITVLPYEVTDEEENRFSGLFLDSDFTADDVSFINNGTIDIQAEGNVDVWGNTFVNAGVINNGADGYFAAVALDSLTNRGEIVNNGTLMLPIGRTAAGDGSIVANGTITNEAGASITNNGYMVVSWGVDASLINKGTITSGGGISIMRPVENSGTITFQGESYNEIYSIAEASDGQPHVAGLNNTGAITVSGESAFDIHGNGVETHAVNAAGGTITVEGGSNMALLGGAVLDNQGTIVLKDGNIDVGIDYTYTDEESGEEVRVSEVGVLTNNGTISGDGDPARISVAIEGSKLVNNKTIQFAGESGNITIRLDGAVENKGEITACVEVGVQWEGEESSGALVNDGTITIGAGQFINVVTGSSATNNGTITVAEGGSWWVDEENGSSLTGSEIVDQNPADKESGEEA